MEIFLRDLLKSLKDEGSEVAGLVHHHLSARASSRDEVEGIPIFRVSSLGQILYTPISPSFPFVLRQVIRFFRPHILHLHLPNPSVFWGLALPEARSVPWVIQWQSDVVPSAIDRRLQPAYHCYRPLEQQMLKRAEKILVASKPYLHHSIPLKPWISKCTVVPLGVDPERLPWPEADALQQAERSWRSGCLRVLAVGRLTYYKGFDVLIRAAGRTKGVAVQIVGDGNLRTHLQKAIRRKDLENRVLLRGELSNEMLQALFATCHVFCLPSLERTEAFGVVLLEAMRYGKPIVASDIPGSGPGWVVGEGNCGWLVPPGDVDALAIQLENLAAEPGVCRELGRKGRDNFGKKFHIQSVARGVNEIYEGILESSGVAGS
jgi:glycosyltransferase involved in cell wall biosynthesis